MVVGECKGLSATEGMACGERYSWERKAYESGKEGERAFRDCVGIGVGFVQFEALGWMHQIGIHHLSTVLTSQPPGDLSSPSRPCGFC